MSPRQLGALSDRFRRRQQREDLLFGYTAAAAANYGFGAPQDKYLQPWDLIPGIEVPEQPEMSDEQMEAVIKPFVVNPPSQSGAG